MSVLNQFPPRAAFVDASGKLTREGYLYLQNIYERLGGADSSSNADIDISLQFDTSAIFETGNSSEELQGIQQGSAGFAEVAKQLADINQETIVSLLATVAEQGKQIEELRQQIAFDAGQPATAAEIRKRVKDIVRPTVTGSRAANAALASLLTALANYGLITDTTTV